MVFTKRVLWFKTIRYVIEPFPDIEKLKKNYSAIYIVTYEKKEIPGFTVRIKDTPVIYFDKSLEEIFSRFNRTTRNEILKTLNHKIQGLKFVSSDPDLLANYRLSKAFEYQQGRVPERISQYRGCRCFAAYFHEEIISSIICFDNEKILRAKAICSKRLESSEKATQKMISYATRRLVYEICRYGKEHGYDMFDLGAVNFQKKNLAQFKMNFTGDLIHEYTYTWKSRWFKIFEKGVGVKKIIKKIFRA